MMRAVIAGLVLAWAVVSSRAATIVSASASRDDVAAAIALATDGDTISIPAASALWTNGVPEITKDIVIQGAGIGLTIISNKFVAEGSNLRFNLSSPSTGPRVTGLEFRDGGQTNSTGGPLQFRFGHIHMTGVSTNFRVDHCKFDRALNTSVRIGGAACGVIDHNEHISVNDQFVEFFHSGWAGGVWGDASWSSPIAWGSRQAVYVEDNTITGVGANSLAACDTYGGIRFVWRYNTHSNANMSSHGTGDGSGRNRGPFKCEAYGNIFSPPSFISRNAFHWRGGPLMWFINTITNHGSALTCHYYRFYLQNKGRFGAANGLNAFDINDTSDTYGTPGDGIFYAGTAGAGSTNNILTVTGGGFSTDQWVGYIVRVPLTNMADTIWAPVRAAAVGNVNLAAPGGVLDGVTLAVNDRLLLPFQSDNTANGLYVWSGSTSALVRSTDADSTPEFVVATTVRVLSGTVNGGLTFQFIGTRNANEGAPVLGTTSLQFVPEYSSICKASTATTLTVEPDHQGYEPKPFRQGTLFEIRRILLALDQIGAGQCDLLTDTSPDPVPVNLHQTYEPIYSWSNRLDGVTDTYSLDAGIRENIHAFGETNSFNGTSGMGIGTLAQMAAITPTLTNVAFWATDAGGNWQTLAGGANDGALYRWNGASWVAYYTPLIYPHPLVSGSPAPPSPPSAPTGFSVIKLSSSQTQATWTDASSDEDGFVLERSLTGGGAGFQPVATIPANTTTWVDGSLNQATTYFYRLRAFNGGGFSAYTAEASATTDALVTTLPRGRRAGLGVFGRRGL